MANPDCGAAAGLEASGKDEAQHSVEQQSISRVSHRSGEQSADPIASLFGQTYRPVPASEMPGGATGPPRLYVVVDTEAEFDWTRPFSRSLTQVSAIAAQQLAQSIFDRYGIRPVYVIDYPVAAQPEGVRPLRAILERGGCEIGAHLHPWTNPPFEETLSTRNSYPGNLEPELEASKLARLLEAIDRGFGLHPAFYKAGRYGVGPATMDIVARNAIPVDFSILPGSNLSDSGGPDFRRLRPVAYRVGDGRVLSVPMTRGYVGSLARWERWLSDPLDALAARTVRLRGLLDAAGLLRKATLTPEGVGLALQCQLVRSLLARGRRTFVLHYHSPSLLPGNTPYVSSQAELDVFLRRLDGLCRFFLEELGGQPGEPRDLAALARRQSS